MFDWVLNKLLNTITTFFPGFSKLKLMTFSIIFSTINFRYQYLPEAKAYLEPWSFFHEIFFCKIHKKTPVLESQVNKVTGLYPEISLKERTPTQVFSGEFGEILKTPFSQNTCRRVLLFFGKNKLSANSKEPSEKRENIEKACKKNNHTGKTKT